jgi:hypothetical protein
MEAYKETSYGRPGGRAKIGLYLTEDDVAKLKCDLANYNPDGLMKDHLETLARIIIKEAEKC